MIFDTPSPLLYEVDNTVRQAMPSARKTRVRRRGITERGAVLSLGGGHCGSLFSLCKIYLDIYLGAAASKH